jgi:hypothetical protein
VRQRHLRISDFDEALRAAALNIPNALASDTDYRYLNAKQNPQLVALCMEDGARRSMLAKTVTREK